MFLSIVNDSFAVVKARTADQLNEYELIDFVWNKFKKLIGVTSAQVDTCEGGSMYVEGK